MLILSLIKRYWISIHPTGCLHLTYLKNKPVIANCSCLECTNLYICSLKNIRTLTCFILGKKINIKSVLYHISSLVLILAEQFTKKKKHIANRFLSSPPSFPCLFHLFFLSLKQSPKP